MNQRSGKGLETNRLVASVATFIPESLLVGPYEIAMPGEEKTVAMYIQALVNVDGDKVIETGPCCRGP